jgi:hypothetical protein
MRMSRTPRLLRGAGVVPSARMLAVGATDTQPGPFG